MSQPIIRGIQAVGTVDVWYKYNGGTLYDATGQMKLMSGADNNLATGKGILMPPAGLRIAGFRLDGEFLRANPQIASSVVIPILGGGGVALTNNNRSGSITFNCAKVSSPSTAENTQSEALNSDGSAQKDASGNTVMIQNYETGAMSTANGMGPVNQEKVYDMTLIAQLQMTQAGGDSMGATICVEFFFNGTRTKVQFEGCTVATVDPLALSGNDAASYNVVFNYLNWKMSVGDTDPGLIAA